MTKGKLRFGEITVGLAGTKEAPLIELEFWPPQGDSIGIRLKPEGAMAIIRDLTAALVDAGVLGEA